MTSPEALTPVFDRMVDGVVVIDAAGRVVYQNGPAAALIGVGEEPVIAAAVRDVAATGRREVEIGALRYADVTVSEIPWDGAHASLVVLREVTERRRAQASLVLLAEDLRAANQTLRLLADKDALTGVLNRRGLGRILDRDLAPRLRLGEPLAAVMIDCDDFKRVNDAFGHVAGDGVLRLVADRIRGALRPSDPIGRVGGDEFLALLPGAGASDALAAAHRIRDAVARGSIPGVPGRDVRVTVSVGVIEVPADAASLDAIVARADARLRLGRARGAPGGRFGSARVS